MDDQADETHNEEVLQADASRHSKVSIYLMKKHMRQNVNKIGSQTKYRPEVLTKKEIERLKFKEI